MCVLRATVLLCSLCTGCSLIIDTGDLGGGNCDWQAANLDPCELPDPGAPMMLTNTGTYEYNTDNKTLRLMPDGTNIDHVFYVLEGWAPESVAIVVEEFELGANANLNVFGMVPLVIVSHGSIDIDGNIDIGSLGTNTPPAGANSPIHCPLQDGFATSAGGQDNGGGGGGGGGGFQGIGGNGGAGGPNSLGQRGDGVDEFAGIPQRPRGGCAGGKGGNGSPDRIGGDGGNSGGAIQLSARVDVLVTGMIDARGGGGRGSMCPCGKGGGGGGGSGGYVLLDAPLVVVSAVARVFAGGGGGGGGAAMAGRGENGEAGQVDGSGALGGTIADTSAATPGGNGSTLSDANGTSAADAAVDPGGGGGGGGGAAGFIVVRAESMSLDGITHPVFSDYPEITQ